MLLIKILKRRDASSVLVAILLAMIIQQPLISMTGTLASKIAFTHDGPFGIGAGSGHWKDQYLFPLVWALVEIVVLEILAWIVILANRPMKRSKR
jgi:hypothetical protein